MGMQDSLLLIILQCIVFFLCFLYFSGWILGFSIMAGLLDSLLTI